MKRFLLLLALVGAGLFVAPQQAHAGCFAFICWGDEPASAPPPSNGALAIQLSQDLLCGTFNIISGNLGLLLGFLIAAWGLYLWIAKDSMKMGLVYIICGALLTALPGLVFSTMRGLNVALHGSGITNQTTLKTPTCTRIGGSM